jgi:hypothetical protein
MKQNIIIVIIAIILVVGVFVALRSSTVEIPIEEQKTDTVDTGTQAPVQDATPETDTQTPAVNEKETVIGKSVDGADITAYHYGTGDTELLFVGGIHGGYSWNTTLVAYELMDYLDANPSIIPSNVKVTVVPVLNPDGLMKVTGETGRFTASDILTSVDTIPGRFNSRSVDLNRNFDCEWQASGTWQNRTVSGGTSAFSEPESRAVRDYIQKSSPNAVVVWYSAAGGVYASNCLNGVLPETTEIMNVYAKASGYPAYKEFDYYEITGDMVNWLAKENIPAISVLLTNHTSTEWSKNEAGIKALLNHYAE